MGYWLWVMGYWLWVIGYLGDYTVLESPGTGLMVNGQWMICYPDGGQVSRHSMAALFQDQISQKNLKQSTLLLLYARKWLILSVVNNLTRIKTFI